MNLDRKELLERQKRLEIFQLSPTLIMENQL